MADIAAHLEQQGFCLIAGVAGPDQIQALKAELANADCARSERNGQTYGARNILGLPRIRAIATLPWVRSSLLPVLGEGFRAVRALFFDKTAGANWPVPWHQDLSLAVRERHELSGWHNWSVKRGVVHVQPPPEILERMVTLRLHLDDCPMENGALRVISGSHRKGLLDRPTIQSMAGPPAETIIARTGDALFMRPLILHCSSPARIPGHRRVLHLEFAAKGLLPPDLAWAEADFAATHAAAKGAA